MCSNDTNEWPLWHQLRSLPGSIVRLFLGNINIYKKRISSVNKQDGMLSFDQIINKRRYPFKQEWKFCVWTGSWLWFICFKLFAFTILCKCKCQRTLLFEKFSSIGGKIILMYSLKLKTRTSLSFHPWKLLES